MSVWLNERSDGRPTPPALGSDPTPSDVVAVLDALVEAAGPDGLPPVALRQSLADACVRTTARGRITEVNPAATALLAPYGASSLDDRRVTDLARGADRDVLRELLGGAEDGPRHASFLQLTTDEGEPVVVTVATATLAGGDRLWVMRGDDDGNDTRLGHMWRHVPAAGYVCRLEPGWPCLQVSPGLVDLLGDAPDAWVARPRTWIERVHADDRERLVVEREQARTERRRLDTEYRIRDVDGTDVWVHDVAWFEFRDDEPVRAHGVLVDVSARRHASSVLEAIHEQGRDELHDVRRQLGTRTTLLRVLAHDVRTPLAGASGWIDTMLRDDMGLDDATARDMLHRARQDLRRLATLVQEVLDSQRGHGPSLAVPSGEPVALDAVVAETVAHLTGTGQPVDVRGTVTARVDHFVAGRIVTNLVERARRRSPDGGCVEVHLAEEDGGVVIGVEDDGDPPSRPEDVLSTDDLALVIVDELVRGQGGSVLVQPGARGGTLVEARLPTLPG